MPRVSSRLIFVFLAMKKEKAVAKLRKKRGREPTNEEVESFLAKRKQRKDGTGEKVETWRERHGVKVEPDNDEKYAPSRSWNEARSCVCDELLEYCEKTKKWTEPTPIQAQCWPIMSTGKDVVAIAETGSGKTLAFAMTSLSKKPKKLTTLVLAPTRELAQQSFEVIDEFSKVVGTTAAVAFGGVAKTLQASKIKKCGTLVATPGRLWDLASSDPSLLKRVELLVLDEADRMLDMGFVNVVRDIVAAVPSTRQTVMFSATWPYEVRKVAQEFLRSDMVKVATVVERDEPTANVRVSQTVHVLDERRRDSELLKTLNSFFSSKSFEKSKTIVFGLYKRECARIAQFLERNSWNCVAIHGDMSQAARTASFEQFKKGEAPLLVATDVAARGLDIPNVELVINYSFPLTIEDYVHRIGRTGRAGKSGCAITFFHGTGHEKALAGALQNVLRQAQQDVPEALLAFGSTVKKKEHKLYGAFGPKDDGIPLKKATKITFD